MDWDALQQHTYDAASVALDTLGVALVVAGVSGRARVLAIVVGFGTDTEPAVLIRTTEDVEPAEHVRTLASAIARVAAHHGLSIALIPPSKGGAG